MSTVSAIMSNCAYKCFTYSKVTCKNSLELGSFQVTWQTSVTRTLCSAEALYVFPLHLCRIRYDLRMQVKPILTSNTRISCFTQEERKYQSSRTCIYCPKAQLKAWGKGCYWIAHAINYSPEMGLDCTAREHTLQQISREAATLACTGGKAGIILSKPQGHYQGKLLQTQKQNIKEGKLKKSIGSHSV